MSKEITREKDSISKVNANIEKEYKRFLHLVKSLTNLTEHEQIKWYDTLDTLFLINVHTTIISNDMLYAVIYNGTPFTGVSITVLEVYRQPSFFKNSENYFTMTINYDGPCKGCDSITYDDSTENSFVSYEAFIGKHELRDATRELAKTIYEHSNRASNPIEDSDSELRFRCIEELTSANVMYSNPSAGVMKP